MGPPDPPKNSATNAKPELVLVTLTEAIFMKNRCDVIRSEFNRTAQCLHETHVMEQLDTQAREQTPGPLDYELILHWIPTELNTEDLRTKDQT